MILSMHYYSNGQGNLNLMTDLYLSCNCHSSHWPKLGMQGVGSASTKRLLLFYLIQTGSGSGSHSPVTEENSLNSVAFQAAQTSS